jgi:hypothetical protein
MVEGVLLLLPERIFPNSCIGESAFEFEWRRREWTLIETNQKKLWPKCSGHRKRKKIT